MGEVVARSPLDAGAWTSHVAANTPDGEGLRSPVLVVHGDRDQLVPVGSVRSGMDRMCAAGARVEPRVVTGADHGGVPAAAGADVVAWARERLAGRPAASTCPR